MAATHFSGPVDSAAGFYANGTSAIDASGQLAQTQTSLTATALNATTVTVDTGTKTATATAGAATLNKRAGVVTSESLTTAAGSDYTLTLTNSTIAATDIVLVSITNGTNTTAPIYVHTVTPGSGSVAIKVRNANGSATALNGTIKIAYLVVS